MAIAYDGIGRSLETDFFRLDDELTDPSASTGVAHAISSTRRCCR